MAFTLRVFFGKERFGSFGRMPQVIFDPRIHATSVVLMSAAEAFDLVGPGVPQPIVFNPGSAADIYVTNVCPREGAVDFILHINWGSPLNVVVDVTVLDIVPQVRELT